VPLGITDAVWVSSLSSTDQPEMSTGSAPVLMSSTQSPGVPPFDSTSLMWRVVIGGSVVVVVVVVDGGGSTGGGTHAAATPASASTPATPAPIL
jgi:hypothetical protein